MGAEFSPPPLFFFLSSERHAGVAGADRDGPSRQRGPARLSTKSFHHASLCVLHGDGQKLGMLTIPASPCGDPENAPHREDAIRERTGHPAARSLGPRLRQLAVQCYIAGVARLVRISLASHPAGRSLERVCIVSALARRTGIASGALLQYRALRRLGIDAELVDGTPALRNPFFRAPHRPASAYIFHCGGPQTVNMLSAALPGAAEAWRIAYWAWELPDPPPDWRGSDRLVHEIWTPSHFAQASLRRLTALPVHVVPHAVASQPPRRRDWSRPFTVLAMADSRSSFARKNPAGAIRAFVDAFGTSSQARLVLKLTGSDEDVAALAAMAASRPNIRLLRRYLDEAAMQNLLRGADALLSLHRAEGFGLPLLEAMAHGTPVVATGWSGNLEFMTAANAELVPCRLVPVRDPAAIYHDSLWAEPDIAAAAAALQRLAQDRVHYEELAAEAHASVADAAFRLPQVASEDEARRDRLRALVLSHLGPGGAGARA